MCEAAARAPTTDRPDLRATIGFVRLMRRASLENFCGLPKLSRYSRMTDVFGSRSQNSSKSFPDTSALLPTDTKLEMPIFNFFA